MCDLTHVYAWHDFELGPVWVVTWLIYMCHMSHSYVRHASFICATCLIHMCGMSHSYVWHSSFTCATWLIYTCDMLHLYVQHALFICAMCHMPHWYVRQAAFICIEPANIHMHRGRNHSYVRQETFISTAWLIQMCDMIHSYVWRDVAERRLPFAVLGVMCHTFKRDSFTRVTWLIRMRYNSLICAVTHLCVPWLMHVCHDSCICAMTDSYVPWLIHMCHDAHVRVTVPWESFKCAMTHAYVCHDSVECYDFFTKCDMTHSDVPWLIHMCRDLLTRTMTHSYIPRESFRSHLIVGRVYTFMRHASCMYVMTHAYAWHDTFICLTWLIRRELRSHFLLTWSSSLVDEWA